MRIFLFGQEREARANSHIYAQTFFEGFDIFNNSVDLLACQSAHATRESTCSSSAETVVALVPQYASNPDQIFAGRARSTYTRGHT